MKRAAAILVALIAAAVLLVTGSAAGGDDGPYQVRAIFDNASFLVDGEEVRIAGAKVGTITDVEVTRPRDGARRGRRGSGQGRRRARRSTNPDSRTSAPTPRA